MSCGAGGGVELASNARRGRADVDLWPVVGAVVMPLVGVVGLTVLAVYVVVWAAIEVRGAIRRLRRRRRRREAGQG